jgi:hypothetical protein
MASTILSERGGAVRGTSRLYLFGLVAISAFLLAVIVSGNLLSVHQAETTVLLRAAAPEMPELSPDALRVELLARENLLPALAKLGLDDWAAPRVRVDARRTESGDVRVHVAYSDGDGTRASAVANELAERCAAGYQSRLKQYSWQTWTAARRQMEQAVQEKQQLDLEIRRFLDEVLPQTVRLSDGRWSDPFRRQLLVLPPPRPRTGQGTGQGTAQGTGHDTAQGVVQASGESHVDPNEIRRELAECDRLLAHRRTYMQEEHPHVQDLLLTIQRLEASLLNLDPLGPKRPPAASPEGKPAAAAVAATAAAPAAASVARTANLTEAQSAAASAIKGYRDRFEQLNTRHQSLAQAENAAWENYHSLEQRDVSQIEPARRTLLLDRPRWKRYLAMMAALAGTLGIGMVLVARRGDRAFYSAEQVGRELALPVVAALGAAKLSAGRVAHAAQRGARTACEGLLALIVVWLVMLSALDRSFLLELTGDPLAAIALAWQHTMG